MRALCWLCACGIVAGCSSSGSSTTTTAGAPKVTDYSIACAADGDCVLIDTSNDACCGGCASAAIAKSDLEKYQGDRNRFRATCSSAAPCPDRSCPGMYPVCDGGKCKASPTPTDAGTDARTD